MTITAEVVEYVARLSCLELEGKDTELFREQLSAILGHVAQLEELDTSDVEPTSHVAESLKNVFRQDEPAPSLDPEEVLAMSPARKDTFFKVPKIIDG